MEDNTTPSTSTTGGGNTAMFVIGALVLAGILGYVIFSSNNNDDTTEQPTTAAPVESTEPATEPTEEGTDSNTMNGETPTMENQDLKLTLDNSAEVTTIDTSSTATDVKVFNIEAGFPYYKPNLITVKKGDTVRIVMNSVDMQHDFIIDELNVRMPVTKSGETNTVEFVAGQTGSFEFYCSVGQHRQNGQYGTLVVQ